MIWKSGYYTSIVIVAGLLFLSCGNAPKETDTATSGEIKIGFDESLASLGGSLTDAFQGMYTRTKLIPVIKPESDIIQDLLDDSVRIILSARPFLKEETDYIRGLTVTPKQYELGFDAIVLIVNEKNTDTLIRLPWIKDIFQGKITKWTQVSGGKNNNGIDVVFDNPKSSIVRQIMSLTGQKSLQGNFYALKNNQEVINYVSTNANAIGLISKCSISEIDQKEKQNLQQRINMVAITDSDTSRNYYLPLQGTIADSTYPLRRPIYLLSRDPKTGLATGFAAYAISDIGQRIILKSGLIPVSMPSRTIQIIKND